MLRTADARRDFGSIHFRWTRRAARCTRRYVCDRCVDVRFAEPRARARPSRGCGWAGDDTGGLMIDLSPTGGRGKAVNPPVLGPAGRPLVVLDPGHGGRDPGATSPYGQRREKDVTLALARAMRDELLASRRVRVALTRNDDRYLVHQERYEIARRLGAELFVSVHADAAPANDGARGATVYTLSEVASDRQAALLAAQENSSASSAEWPSPRMRGSTGS
jgi:N-acetylmuramoyl-L-alanine amidase